MKKIYYILLLLVVGLTSCDDFLGKMPDDRTVIDTPEKIGELLTYAYPNQNHQMFCYAMSDNATEKKSSARKNDINKDAYDWAEFRLTSQDTPESYWKGCYTAIKQANHALDAIEKFKVAGEIPENIKPYYGEALLARAYCHFMLVTLWSKSYNPATAENDLGIPYVTKPETSVLAKYERGNVAEVYKNIEKDILEGLSYIDDRIYQNKKLHWNSKAAHTFAARFYSCKGDFKKVLHHSEKALGNNYSEQLRDLAAYTKMDINEAILEWGRTRENANLLVVPQYSNWFVYFYGSYLYGMSIDFYRFVFRTSFVGKEWAWNLYGADPDIFFVKWGYHTQKDGLNSDVGYYMIMNTLIDIEEALFLKMEANVMLKNYPEFSSDMNIYLGKRLKGYDTNYNLVTYEKIEKEYKEENYKYGLSPFYEIDEKQRVYLNCLYDIRRKEYYYTGMRWFDHKRFNTRVRHYYTNGDVKWLEKDDKRRELQIPLSAQAQGIEANPR